MGRFFWDTSVVPGPRIQFWGICGHIFKRKYSSQTPKNAVPNFAIFNHAPLTAGLLTSGHIIGVPSNPEHLEAQLVVSQVNLNKPEQIPEQC